MKNFFFLLSLLTGLIFTSCRDDFEFEPSTGNLEFSKDTVYLDTVFTNHGSSTYRLKVYNRSSKDISIPNIRLSKGESSNYRLMVDGMPGKNFNNVELLAKDSLYIFVETTIDYAQYQNQTAEYLYTDQIQFDYGSKQQNVELVTLVKDAYFLYPKRYTDNSYEHLLLGDEPIYGFVLDENDPVNGNELQFNNTKPYVIYGYAAIPNNKTLTIQAGAQIHFHYGSGIIGAQNATLQVNGTVSNPVVFQSNRLEPMFEDVAGQWGAIWMTSGSTANINNAIIKNGTIGLLLEDNQNELYNVQLYNHTHYGILARHAQINAENVVTNNLGKASAALSLGGNYNFTHCTLANYGAAGTTTSLLMDNGDGSNAYALTQANFNNCILYGTATYALSFSKEGITNFNFSFKNSLIKFSDYGQFSTNMLYPLANTTDFQNCIISKNNNKTPKFRDTSKNDLIIGEDSFAKALGGNFSNSGLDILGNLRLAQNADAGAYNHIIFD